MFVLDGSMKATLQQQQGQHESSSVICAKNCLFHGSPTEVHSFEPDPLTGVQFLLVQLTTSTWTNSALGRNNVGRRIMELGWRSTKHNIERFCQLLVSRRPGAKTSSVTAGLSGGMMYDIASLMRAVKYYDHACQTLVLLLSMHHS